jgi:hypothetical protein
VRFPANALLVGLALGGGIVLFAGAAAADDRATAQRLFEEGQALFSQGELAKACAKFEGAAALVSSPGVRLNLARCWERLGRTASAWTKYDEALVAAERVGDAAAAAAARHGRASVEPRLSRMVITAADGVAPGLQILRDGEALPSSVLGSEVPVDPGVHEVVARAAGYKPWVRRVTVVGEGSVLQVAIPVLEREPTKRADENATPVVPDVPAASAAPGPASSAPSATLAATSGADGAGRAFTITGVAAAGVGVVGLALGAYFGFTAQSKWNQANRSGGACLDAACPGLTQDASNAATLSTVSFVAGGVLAAAGVTLWLLAPKGASSPSGSALFEGAVPRPRAELGPELGPNRAGLTLRGAW